MNTMKRILLAALLACVTAASAQTGGLYNSKPGGGGGSIGSAVGSGTAGSILFVSTGPVLAQDNANLHYFSGANGSGIGVGRTEPWTAWGLANARGISIEAGSGAQPFIDFGLTGVLRGQITAAGNTFSFSGGSGQAAGIYAGTGAAVRVGSSSAGSAAVAGAGAYVEAGTTTTDVNALNVTQTWNAGGVTFTSKKTNITATAYTSGSLIEDWQIGGTSTGAFIKNTNNVEFRVGPAGELDTSSGYNFLHVNGSTAGVITTSNANVRKFNMYHDGTSMLYQGVVAVSGTSHYFLSGNSTKVFRIFSQNADADRGAVAGGSNAGYYLTDTAGDSSATRDTGLSRISAGLWAMGTGAAGSFAGRLKLTSTINAGTTIANLNASPTAGEISTITDQLTACPAKGVAPTAGGSVVCPVFYNGTAWVGI